MMANKTNETVYINAVIAEQIFKSTGKTYAAISTDIGKHDRYISNCLGSGTMSKQSFMFLKARGIDLTSAECSEDQAKEFTQQRRNEKCIDKATINAAGSDIDRIIEAINSLEATIRELWK